MTEKQEKILNSALELFAQEGFKATSTSKVAKHAGVSEGLIFRHFGNKDGLLDSIMQQGEERAKILYSDMIFENDPKAVILKYLNVLLDLLSNPSELEFWKLQYKIKWETEQYNGQKMEPMLLALINAFKKLGYNSPEMEARNLIFTIDGIATQYFLKEFNDIESVIKFLKNKYEV